MRLMALLVVCVGLASCGGESLPQAQAAIQRPLTVVIGDSITAGYMPVGGALQLRQDLSYTASLQPITDVVTAAVGGASTAAALGTQVEWLKTLPADVVVIMLGTNDAVQGLDRAQALFSVRAIADAWPKARVVLVAPPSWDAAADGWLAPWAADLRTLANSRGAVFVDLFAASEKAQWLCHPVDRHPCPQAHKEMGRLVRAGAAQALERM